MWQGLYLGHYETVLNPSTLSVTLCEIYLEFLFESFFFNLPSTPWNHKELVLFLPEVSDCGRDSLVKEICVEGFERSLNHYSRKASETFGRITIYNRDFNFKGFVSRFFVTLISNDFFLQGWIHRSGFSFVYFLGWFSTLLPFISFIIGSW